MEQELTLCTTAQIAERFSVHPASIRKWVQQGRLKPAMKTPGGHMRFRASDVAELLQMVPAA